jgi:hypothetical protein
MGSTDADVLLMRIGKALFEIWNHIGGLLGISERVVCVRLVVHGVSVLTR